MGEAVDESLKHLLRVNRQSSEHLAYEMSHFGVGTKTDQVEETAIASRVEIRSVLLLAESVGQQQRERKRPKRVEASTQPCFTPLLIEKGSVEDPLYWTVPCMSS